MGENMASACRTATATPVGIAILLGGVIEEIYALSAIGSSSLSKAKIPLQDLVVAPSSVLFSLFGALISLRHIYKFLLVSCYNYIIIA